jgi:hypothetical protein
MRFLLILVLLANNCFTQSFGVKQNDGLMLHHSGDYCGVNVTEDTGTTTVGGLYPVRLALPYSCRTNVLKVGHRFKIS